MKRVFLIVLDSFGIGELPDSADFGDLGANTIASVSKTGKLSVPNMKKMGLFNIDGVKVGERVESASAAYGRSGELSRGKDTTVGHWEISGVISERPLPTYPNGFPEEILEKLSLATGRKILCNKPYSGTQVLLDYGREHEKNGDLIVYTSADSVLQIAAHENVISVPELYDICEKARKIMQGEHGVGRIIARPYIGEYPNYTRTANRRDFSLEPSGVTMLDEIKASGLDVIAVGKIEDIFAGKGITKAIHTGPNHIGLSVTSDLVKTDFNGLCFVNLVDFDSVYGHRNNADGYADALNEFDLWLGNFLPELRDDDLLIITADHGCDPGDISTDHTREYVPILVYGSNIAHTNLGTRKTFADISATVTDFLGVTHTGEGQSFRDALTLPTEKQLLKIAADAAKGAYSPYSGFCVGAALLTYDGDVYTGCNIENASYTPTVCAERTAFFKAVSEGKRDFKSIAIVGGKREEIIAGNATEICPPCGVCRQVMAEFCKKDEFEIILGLPDNPQKYTLSELLPLVFDKNNL